MCGSQLCCGSMERVTSQPTAEGYAATLENHIPERLHSWAACDLFTGDAVFAGFNTYTDGGDDGRSYSVTAHVMMPFHQEHMPRAARRTTLVLPDPEDADWWTVTHEVGHVVDWWLYERAGAWPSLAAPCASDYYRRNRWEAFTGAFMSYALLPRPGFADRYIDYMAAWLWPDPEVEAFFDALPWRP